MAAHGAIPVVYGEGLRERLLTAAGTVGIDALIDLFGPEYLDLAADLGVRPERLVSVTSFERARELGAKITGSAQASTPEVLAALTNLVAAGALEVPIAASYPLARVAEAYAELGRRHTRGKIVLVP